VAGPQWDRLDVVEMLNGLVPESSRKITIPGGLLRSGTRHLPSLGPPFLDERPHSGVQGKPEARRVLFSLIQFHSYNSSVTCSTP
jgi:hypothetical protein